MSETKFALRTQLAVSNIFKRDTYTNMSTHSYTLSCTKVVNVNAARWKQSKQKTPEQRPQAAGEDGGRPLQAEMDLAVAL